MAVHPEAALISSCAGLRSPPPAIGDHRAAFTSTPRTHAQCQTVPAWIHRLGLFQADVPSVVRLRQSSLLMGLGVPIAVGATANSKSLRIWPCISAARASRIAVASSRGSSSLRLTAPIPQYLGLLVLMRRCERVGRIGIMLDLPPPHSPIKIGLKRTNHNKKNYNMLYQLIKLYLSLNRVRHTPFFAMLGETSIRPRGTRHMLSFRVRKSVKRGEKVFATGFEQQPEGRGGRQFCRCSGLAMAHCLLLHG
jgi:hypothetical protein